MYNEKKKQQQLNGIFNLRAKYIVKKISEEELLTVYQAKWSHRRENYRKFNIYQQKSRELDLTFHSLLKHLLCCNEILIIALPDKQKQNAVGDTSLSIIFMKIYR